MNANRKLVTLIIIVYSAISESEKRDIKGLLLSQSFKEPVPQIAIQIAVLIGNISRTDYPQDWNEVNQVSFFSCSSMFFFCTCIQ